MKYYLFWWNFLWSVESYFFPRDNFQGSFIVSQFMMLTPVLMKELACILIYVCKIFNCRAFFRICCQCASLLGRRNFEYGMLEKITVTVSEVAVTWVSFRNVGSKQKIKMKTWNTIASSHHLKVKPAQKMTVLLFSCLVHRVGSLVL